MARGFVDEVVTLCGGKVIARHPRDRLVTKRGSAIRHYLIVVAVGNFAWKITPMPLYTL